MSESGRGIVSHHHILIGLILGAILGSGINFLVVPPSGSGQTPPLWLQWVLKYITEPMGQIFLRLLVMTVVPLVFCSLALGVAKLGSMQSLGRIGGWTLGYFLFSTTFAVVIGLVLVNWIRPGIDIEADTREQLQAIYQTQAADKLDKTSEFGVNTFIALIPRNPIESAARMDMLGVIFFAILFGAGLTILQPARSQVVQDTLEAIGDVMVFIIQLAMRLAPYGVFALIFTTTAKFGFDLLRQLGVYMLVVLVGLTIQMVIIFPLLLRTLGGVSPLDFFGKVRFVIVTAFSTSSSNATLPTSLRTAQVELNIPAPIAGFVLPLGATMNMNGTALFEGVTVLFLAQVFGIELSIGQQLIVVVLCVLTAIGAAGVPGGSIPLIAMVLAAVGIKPEAIAIVLGVDRFLDMCRTTLNVVGDLIATVLIHRRLGERSIPSNNDLTANHS